MGELMTTRGMNSSKQLKPGGINHKRYMKRKLLSIKPRKINGGINDNRRIL